MVNYDLLLINVPMLTMGTIAGIIMNEILPEIMICLVLVCVLVISLKKTIFRYKKQILKEKTTRVENKVPHDELKESDSF